MHLPFNTPYLLDPAGVQIAGQVFGSHQPRNPLASNAVVSTGNLQPAVTVTNTVVETTIFRQPLPPAFFYKGMDVRLGGMGIHTNSVGGQTARVRVYKGSTVLLDTTAVTTGMSTNAIIEVRAHITGQSQTSVWAQGFYSEQGGGVNFFQMVNTSATAINANAENLIVTFQWGSATTSSSVTWTNLSAYEAVKPIA